MLICSTIKRRPFLITILALLLFITTSSSLLSTQSHAGVLWELTYQIDRSQVPDLYYNDLTVLIDVGTVNSASVEVDGGSVSSTYNAASGIVQFTTSGSAILLTIDGAQDSDMPAPASKAALLDNKEWAWSHGFDDNVNLKPAIAAFNAKNWQATLFMITSIIDDTRQQSWIVDKPDLLTYLNQGWGVGSHGLLSTCDGENQAQQLAAIDRLEDIVDDSSVPNYKIISFAVPCFKSNLYIPDFIEILNDGTTDLQFYESGNDYMRLVDPEFVKPHGSVNLPTFSAGEGEAVGLELIGALGRDFSIELSGEHGIDSVLEKLDWMATHASNGRHFWYNTLSHGSSEANLTLAINHVYNNYGPNGTNEAWVAPSDRIYSYILVRDNSQIKLTSIKKGGVPWSQSTQTPNPSPSFTTTPPPTQINTETFTPTDTATATQSLNSTPTPAAVTPTATAPSNTATPSSETAEAIFLPMVRR